MSYSNLVSGPITRHRQTERDERDERDEIVLLLLPLQFVQGCGYEM